jgi:iron complex transport system substrate-binding protein
MIPRILSATLFLAAAAFCAPSFAQLTVRDDLGRSLLVNKPPERVVTLAPFLTEMVYSIGADDLLVGVDSMSDHPPQARQKAQIHTGARFSLEQLAALKPDLVLAWKGGIRKADIEMISAFGATVFVAQANHLDDVPRLLQVIGRLTGHDAMPAVAKYESSLDRLRRENADKLRIATFVELWNRPLTTVSGEHFISEALDICKGDNVFGDLQGSAPKVTWDAVAIRNPYVILGAGSATDAQEFRANWALRANLAAVKAERLVFVDHDAIQRPTPRTPEGIAALCRQLDMVRTGWTAASAAPDSSGRSPLVVSPTRAAPGPVELDSLVKPRAPQPSRAAKPVPQKPAPAAPAAADPPPRRPSQYGM